MNSSSLPSYRMALNLNNMAISLLENKRKNLHISCLETVGSLLSQSVCLVQRTFAPPGSPQDDLPLILQDALRKYYQALNDNTNDVNDGPTVSCDHAICFIDDQDLESLQWHASLPEALRTLPLISVDCCCFSIEECESTKMLRQCATILYNQGVVSLLRLTDTCSDNSTLLSSSLVSFELAEATLSSFLSASASSSAQDSADDLLVNLLRILVLQGLNRIYHLQSRADKIQEMEVSIAALSAMIDVQCREQLQFIMTARQGASAA